MSSRSSRSFMGGGLPLLLVVWFVAEFLAFALVVHYVGLGGALLIGLATSLAGGALLKRLGQTAAAQMRAATRGGVFVATGMTDGLLQGLAALLLLLPGFVSDAIGAALAFGPVRRAVRTYVTGGRSPATSRPGARDPGIVDLQPQDWQRVDGH
jgi:UPF0716 protein FxsA